MVTATQHIIDQTNVEGLTEGAIRMWHAMVQAAGAVGLAEINLQAAAGGGHRSHAHGTEIDVIGFNADGSRWTTEQRVAVAMAAGASGANRFGFYTQGAGPTTLHVGLGYEGAPQNVAWGPNGQVSGVSINSFAPEERAFVESLRGGNLDNYLQSEEVMAYAPEPPQAATPEAIRAVNAMAATVPSLAEVIGSGQIVRQGARGVPVEELQSFLNENGYTDSRGDPLIVDGVFGPRTSEALEAFQSDAGILVDGRAGTETINAMQARIAGAEQADLPTFAAVNPQPVMAPGIETIAGRIEDGNWLRSGASGDAVEQLQRFLNHQGFTGANGSSLTVDGVFGAQTRAALRSFQRANGLTVDGVLGPETLGAMQGARVQAMPEVDGLTTNLPTTTDVAQQGAFYQPAPSEAPLDDIDARTANLPTTTDVPQEGMGSPRPTYDFASMTPAELRDTILNEDLTADELQMAGQVVALRRQQAEANALVLGATAPAGTAQPTATAVADIDAATFNLPMGADVPQTGYPTNRVATASPGFVTDPMMLPSVQAGAQTTLPQRLMVNDIWRYYQGVRMPGRIANRQGERNGQTIERLSVRPRSQPTNESQVTLHWVLQGAPGDFFSSSPPRGPRRQVPIREINEGPQQTAVLSFRTGSSTADPDQWFKETVRGATGSDAEAANSVAMERLLSARPGRRAVQQARAPQPASRADAATRIAMAGAMKPRVISA